MGPLFCRLAFAAALFLSILPSVSNATSCDPGMVQLPDGSRKIRLCPRINFPSETPQNRIGVAGSITQYISAAASPLERKWFLRKAIVGFTSNHALTQVAVFAKNPAGQEYQIGNYLNTDSSWSPLPYFQEVQAISGIIMDSSRFKTEEPNEHDVDIYFSKPGTVESIDLLVQPADTLLGRDLGMVLNANFNDFRVLPNGRLSLPHWNLFGYTLQDAHPTYLLFPHMKPEDGFEGRCPSESDSECLVGYSRGVTIGMTFSMDFLTLPLGASCEYSFPFLAWAKQSSPQTQVTLTTSHQSDSGLVSTPIQVIAHLENNAPATGIITGGFTTPSASMDPANSFGFIAQLTGAPSGSDVPRYFSWGQGSVRCIPKN
jgi:hypothetical protein